MTIDEIRFANLELLRKEFAATPAEASLPDHGSLKRFAEACKLSTYYLSQIQNRRKNIGDNTARTFELGFHKQPGWMDILEHGKNPLGAADRYNFELAAKKLIQKFSDELSALISSLGGTTT